MGPLGWPELVILLVLLLFLGVLVVGIVLLAAGKGKGGEQTCGGCGAVVRWVEQQHCSACGADLRTVGVGRGKAGSGAAIGLAIVVACAVLLVSCCGLMGAGLFLGRATSVVAPPTMQNMPTVADPVETDTPVDVDTLDEESGETLPPESGIEGDG